MAWCTRQARPVTVITRLRLDAALYAPAPALRRSAWYPKARPTFADALAQVRRALWQQLGFWLSEAAVDNRKPPQGFFEHVAELLAYLT